MHLTLIPSLLLIALLSIEGTANAHHSWPANYHVDQEVNLEGVVLRYLWRNPHVFIYLEIVNGFQNSDIPFKYLDLTK